MESRRDPHGRRVCVDVRETKRERYRLREQSNGERNQISQRIARQKGGLMKSEKIDWPWRESRRESEIERVEERESKIKKEKERTREGDAVQWNRIKEWEEREWSGERRKQWARRWRLGEKRNASVSDQLRERAKRNCERILERFARLARRRDRLGARESVKDKREWWRAWMSERGREFVIGGDIATEIAGMITRTNARETEREPNRRKERMLGRGCERETLGKNRREREVDAGKRVWRRERTLRERKLREWENARMQFVRER